MRGRFVNVFHNNRLVLEKVKMATGFFARLRGLMFYRQLPGIGGLMLFPCNSVHMFWMRFKLSLIYLASDGKIIEIVDSISPNQVGPSVREARYVLEARAGFPSEYQLNCGDFLIWKEN